jgi:hypothetical protein
VGRADSLRIRLIGNECIKEWTILRTTQRKRGPLVIWTAPPMKPLWVHFKLHEAIEKPRSDLLASHQRKCECAWLVLLNGDVSHLKTGDEITTHGKCVQRL